MVLLASPIAVRIPERIDRTAESCAVSNSEPEPGGQRSEHTTSLFVYGSLIDAAHRAEIIGREVEATPATIEGFERGRSRYWYLRRREGESTRGLILTNLTAEEIATLDRYEDVPTLYTREIVEVVGQGGTTVRCFVYLPTDWVPQGDG